MPVYEYRCNACGHEFEEWQKITDEPVGTCPKCKKRKVERLISMTSFHLKGGGWYSDLYASSKGDKADKADKAGDSGKAEKADTKAAGDSKPATDSKPAKAESSSGGTKKKKAAAK